MISGSSVLKKPRYYTWRNYGCPLGIQVGVDKFCRKASGGWTFWSKKSACGSILGHEKLILLIKALFVDRQKAPAAGSYATKSL